MFLYIRQLNNIFSLIILKELKREIYKVYRKFIVTVYSTLDAMIMAWLSPSRTGYGDFEAQIHE